MNNVVVPTGGTGTQNTSTTTVLGVPSNKQFYLWGISALTLIAVADPYPTIAIFFTWLLIVGVLLVNASDYISLLQSAIGGS